MSATQVADSSVAARFPLLDGYRALAVLLVLTTHVAFFSGMILVPVIGPLLARMDFGVTVFFVLSGFLLYRPWAAGAMSARGAPRLNVYAVRRAGRILPAYWVMAAATLLALPWLVPAVEHAPWTAWLRYFSLTQIYWPDLPLAGLGQIWSLATEISFYIALPLIAWVAGRVGRGRPTASSRWQLGVLGVAVLIAVLTAVATTAVWPQDLGFAQSWLPAHLDWFAVGMGLAVVHERLSSGGAPRWMHGLRAAASRPGVLLVVSACLWLIASTPLCGPIAFESSHTVGTQITKNLLYALGAAVLLLPGLLGGSSVSGSRWGRLMGGRALTYLGLISYGIFLWHMVIATVIAAHLPWVSHLGNFLMLWPLTVALSVGVATCSWFAIELPIQRWTHRVGVNASGEPARYSR